MSAIEARPRATGREPQARVERALAERAAAAILHKGATEALWAVRFAPATVCEPVARALERAIADSEKRLGIGRGSLVVSTAEVTDGEPMTRVRRHALGVSDWITTLTASITVVLEPRDPDHAHEGSSRP